MQRVIRSVLIFIFLLTALFLGWWLADIPGEFRIEWFGYRIVGQTAVAVFIGVLALVLLMLPLVLWHRLRLAITRWQSMGLVRQRKRIEDVLLAAFSALAAGDSKDAHRQMRQLKKEKAGIWIPFLAAQIAAQKGNADGSQDHFKALLADPRTAFLARHILTDQSLAGMDDGRALEHIKAARRLRPSSVSVLRSLFKLHVRRGEWDDALKIIEGDHLPTLVSSDGGPGGGPGGGDDNARLRAVLLFERSRHAQSQGRLREARIDAGRALDYCATLSPAVVHLARLFLADGHKKKAIRLLSRHWKAEPHIDYASLGVAMSDDALTRLADVEKICRYDLSAIEADIVRAAAAVDAQLPVKAEKIVKKLEKLASPPAEACRLLSRFYDSVGRNGADWQNKALQAPPVGVWECVSCRATSSAWFCQCVQCSSFASLVWKRACDTADEGATAKVATLTS